MKTSISVPDELWDCVKDLGDGPSAVVQQGLSLLCQRNKDPMANAPSDEVKDRVRDAVTAQVERVAGAARRLSEDGYELGVALSSHMSLVELLSLPEERAALQQRLFHIWDGWAHLSDLSATEDFGWWQSNHLEVDDLAAENAEFWSHFDLAIARHIEAAADHSTGADGKSFIVVPVMHEPRRCEWSHHETPDGWWLPDGDPEIAHYFLNEGHLPAAYLVGIVGALLDIGAAASAYAGTDLIEPSVSFPTPAVEGDER